LATAAINCCRTLSILTVIVQCVSCIWKKVFSIEK
jgi:hypothetical protein